MNARTIKLLSALLIAAAFVTAVAQWPPRMPATNEPPPPRVQKSMVSCATWYRVPPDSLAKRRAGANELTAAHNRLPLGTLVRVTNLSNKESVIVRITDRGIPRGQCKIDICQEAAEQIGMISEGITRVRLEILAKSVATVDPKSRPAAAP